MRLSARSSGVFAGVVDAVVDEVGVEGTEQESPQAIPRVATKMLAVRSTKE
jgi:hypothetical protein